MAVQRLNRLTDLLAQCLVGFFISVAGILILDGMFALLGLGTFGNLSGWLALVFPIIFFSGQFAAAKGEPGRLVVTIVGALAGIALGGTGAGLVSHLPPLGSGAIGAFIATIVYAAVWHVGLAVAKKK